MALRSCVNITGGSMTTADAVVLFNGLIEVGLFGSNTI